MAKRAQQVKPDLVMPTATGSLLQRKCACGIHTIGGARCDRCKDHRVLQRKANNLPDAPAVPSIVSDVLRRSGQPLSQAAREFFEPRFGQHLVGSPLRESANNNSHSGLKVSELYQRGRALIREYLPF